MLRELVLQSLDEKKNPPNIHHTAATFGTFKAAGCLRFILKGPPLSKCFLLALLQTDMRNTFHRFRSDLMFTSKSTVLTCHCSEMVEAAPDPVHRHRRVELGASKQRGGNRLRSRRFQQLWAFSQDAVAPNKHLPFI